MKRNLLELSSSDPSHRSLHISCPADTFSNFKNINPNVHILNNSSPISQQHPAFHHQPKKLHLLTPQVSSPVETVVVDPPHNTDSPPNGYWLQPDLSHLSSLSFQALSSVTNFSIGKSNYGKIMFQSPVNLSQFASNWDSLWESVTFSKNLVNVNHLNGEGLNVPAIIQLENVSPSPNQSMDDFINQLKSPLGMEFISYDPHSKIWAFKVDHFSVWGLVNDTTDPNLLSQFNKQQQDEKLKINLSFTNNINGSNSKITSNHQQHQELPGYFSHIDDELIPETQSNDNLDIIDDIMDVNEKTIEPTINDVFKLDKRPAPLSVQNFKVDSNWDRQLSLANSNFSLFNTSLSDSSLSPSFDILKPSKVNEALFKDVEITQKIQQPPKLQFPNADIYSKLFQFYSNNSSTLSKRSSNGFPKFTVDNNSIDLAMERNLFSNDNDKSKLWKLASILWDSSFDLNKRESLCEFIQSEIKFDIPINAPLDSIIDAICRDNINLAIQLSIESNNYHLATMLTAIGQSQEAAELQLDAWTRDNVIQHVPSQIVWIYKLLKGDYTLSDNWSISLFLGLKYTNIGFNEILSSIKSLNADNDNQFYNLVVAYVDGKSDDFDVPTSFLLSTVCGINVSKFDSILINLKRMLLDNGYFEESLYVLSFLMNDEDAKNEITKVVESYITEFNVVDNDNRLGYLNSKYGVPNDVLYIARAKYLSKNGRFYDSAWQYIYGSQISIAYEVCLEHIAPQYVIGGNNNDLLKLKDLLSRFMSQPNWGEGGKIYVDYIDKSPTLNETLPFLETKTWHQRVAKTIMLKLLEHL